MHHCFFFFNDTATTEIYPYGHPLPLPDALPISFRSLRTGSLRSSPRPPKSASAKLSTGRCAPSWATIYAAGRRGSAPSRRWWTGKSEEHTSELQSLMRISYAVFCLKKKKSRKYIDKITTTSKKYNRTKTK